MTFLMLVAAFGAEAAEKSGRLHSACAAALDHLVLLAGRPPFCKGE